MYSSRAHIEQKLGNLARQKPRSREGNFLIEFTCHEIRDIQNGENSQAFKVMDIAFEHDRSHAAIIAAREYSKSYLRKLRNIILDIWCSKPRKTVDDVFGIEAA
jgi:hypothetical protein